MIFLASSLRASLFSLSGELVLRVRGDWDFQLLVCLWCVDSLPKDFCFNSSPTSPRLFMAAWCMCSRGSPSFGYVVNRYACAATRAASGVSCMKYSSSSDNNVLMLFVRSYFLGRSILLLLCFGLWCLSLLESDVLLYSSQCDLLDALLFSWFLIRLKRIYNFWCSMLVFTPFAYCFVTLRGTFMHFPELTY
jgi:hypothetical protein